MLKCPISSSPYSNYSGTAHSIAEMLVNKTVNEVILKLYRYSSVGQYVRFLTINGVEGALQKRLEGRENLKRRP